MSAVPGPMELVVSASYSSMEASVVHSHVGGFTHL